MNQHTDVASFLVTGFDHTNIPFVDYGDIVGDFKSIELWSKFGDVFRVASLDQNKVGFENGAIGFRSIYGTFIVLLLKNDMPIAEIVWESFTNFDGGVKHYTMKIKMDTRLEIDAWPYIAKFVESARKWWIPLSPVVSRTE